MQVGRATLNHQLPIVHGLNAAHRMIEDMSPAAWARQLDQRVFFWPAKKGAAFAASIARDRTIDTLWLDAQAFADAFAPQIDLCALNSGNFTQGGAHALRGLWIYRPLTEGIDAFRHFRRRRGLKKSADAVGEVSLRGSIPADMLRHLLRT
ncbi:hypothetical protein [uncultured Roseobacter sp.]|uniref:DUF7002 family protein n=1 Tax=uncultured Roseobacter sp. TaxID=114847 RepID=UPI002629DDA8|nr:hypothetical protein [uncultured Roseobacter sp.]